MSEFRIEVRGARGGIWGPWREIQQQKRFPTRKAAERWIARRHWVLRPLWRIIPESRLRIEHRVVA